MACAERELLRVPAVLFLLVRTREEAFFLVLVLLALDRVPVFLLPPLMRDLRVVLVCLELVDLFLWFAIS